MQNFAKRVIKRLAERDVEFIVVGGLSAVLQGVPIVTLDLDICYRRTPQNITRLAHALEPFKPQLRGLPPELPSLFDERTLMLGTNFTLAIEDESVDLLAEMSAVGGYDQVISAAETIAIDDIPVKVLSLGHLIASKTAANRAKDLAVLPVLKAAQERRQTPAKPLHGLETAYQTALSALLAERHPDGYWVGELSTSALSTATAISALSLVQKQLPPHNQHDALIAGGLAWLEKHQNEDGGCGDTVKSFSNISTTMLCRAAFHLTGAAGKYGHCLLRADEWLGRLYGSTPEELAEAVRKRYGKDRTFATPILTTCALAGLVSWKEVRSLPFELACFPQSWFRFLRLHVVSYALPALIAIGQAVYRYRPPWNPITRIVRWLARGRSLKVLRAIQPSSGGFLEATPLTSFVTISLAACGLADHPVARNAVEFLVKSVRPDGSWPIDTNLSTWVTTLAINALSAAGELGTLEDKDKLTTWLLEQQYQTRHPYTGAAPGGWAWTPLPGGVPDGDDTPGALLVLSALKADPQDPNVDMGLNWLLDLQNRDGGWPTFCRGWGHLPFDRSGCDLTAHVLRVVVPWARAGGVRIPTPPTDKAIRQAFARVLLSSLGQDRAVLLDETCDEEDKSVLGLFWTLAHSVRDGFLYLARSQRPDGSWLPLWFGNQHAPDDENPTYGTSRVLAAYRDLDMMNTEPARRGVAWLLGAQNPDGGWGGAANTPSSMEETALAVEILLDAPGAGSVDSPAGCAVNKGLAWLVQQVEAGGLYHPTPIGFYFAKLWYFEKLYPMIFTVAALGKARRAQRGAYS